MIVIQLTPEQYLANLQQAATCGALDALKHAGLLKKKNGFVSRTELNKRFGKAVVDNAIREHKAEPVILPGATRPLFDLADFLKKII